MVDSNVLTCPASRNQLCPRRQRRESLEGLPWPTAAGKHLAIAALPYEKFDALLEARDLGQFTEKLDVGHYDKTLATAQAAGSERESI